MARTHPFKNNRHSQPTVVLQLATIATCLLCQPFPPILPWPSHRMGPPLEHLLRNHLRRSARMASAHLTHPSGFRSHRAADNRLTLMETCVPSQPSSPPPARCLLVPPLPAGSTSSSRHPAVSRRTSQPAEWHAVNPRRAALSHVGGRLHVDWFSHYHWAAAGSCL